ncbi:unnamed protein product [Rotaria sp. Silwood2]|nr:unnamed protein product [Rotaria sp. Silwood2]CAF4352406.1 unnamed protein product [Rotaria sp. Silwood2]
MFVCLWLVRFIPMMHYPCLKSLHHQKDIVLPPINIVAEKTTSLAEFLLTTREMSAPLQFVHAKTDIIELRSSVDSSDSDPQIKTQLSTKFHELQTLVQQGGNELT